MHSSTKKRLEFLQGYIKQNARTWYLKYGENISGVRIDKKTREGFQKPYYAIVFNVVEKKAKHTLPENEAIPFSFEIEFPNGKKRKIKTDVRETGAFEFHARLLDSVVDERTGEQGSLGLFLSDNKQNIFALTNYHVAACSLIEDRIFNFDIATDSINYKVLVDGNQCRLFRGELSPELDVAYVLIGEGVPVNNTLPDNRRPNNDFVPGPIPPNYRNKRVDLYLPSMQGSCISESVIDNSQGLNARFMAFDDMVTVRRCDEGGDSGSVVLDVSGDVLGIILGGDRESTFILPYYRIHEFFPLSII